MALIESQNRFPNKPVILEVRTWNKRAVNCYKSQGFEIVETKQQLIIDKKRYFENLKL